MALLLFTEGHFLPPEGSSQLASQPMEQTLLHHSQQWCEDNGEAEAGGGMLHFLRDQCD